MLEPLPTWQLSHALLLTPPTLAGVGMWLGGGATIAGVIGYVEALPWQFAQVFVGSANAWILVTLGITE